MGYASGEGNTEHCWTDFNHVDLTAMRNDYTNNENDGSVEGIEVGNNLDAGIVAASL